MIPMLLILSTLGAADPPPDRDARIALAIDRGVDFLLAEIEKQPDLEPNTKTPYGLVPFEIYALIVSGVSVDHPTVKRGLRFMQEHDFKKKNTYTLACSIFVHDAAIVQRIEDELLVATPRQRAKILASKKIGWNHRQRLAELAQVLIDGQNDDGGWRYYPRQKPSDISCHQFAALGLSLAVKNGVKVPLETWIGAARFCIAMQVKQGKVTDKRITLSPSTFATPRDPIEGTTDVEVRARHFMYDIANFGPIVNAVWNRTCAGVSTLILAEDHCGDAYPEKERDALHRAVRDGYGYLLENWKPYDSYYGIYSLEKLADIGHVQRFGEIDWWDETVEKLLAAQTDAGNWPSTRMWGEQHTRVTTAFALLTLKRATTLLTRNPADSIILTGRRAAEGGEVDPDWVYLPDRDTCVHYPQLARVLRYRPTRKLLRFFGDVVEAYDRDARPGIVPSLIQVRERVTGRGPRKALDGHLERVTGMKLKSLPAYAAWHGTWSRYWSVTAETDRSIVPELETTYADPSTSLPLKRAIVKAATTLGARELVRPLLDDLEHAARDVRTLAYQGLGGLFVEVLPAFDPDGRQGDRAAQVQEIRAWCEARAAVSGG